MCRLSKARNHAAHPDTTLIMEIGNLQLGEQPTGAEFFDIFGDDGPPMVVEVETTAAAVAHDVAATGAQESRLAAIEEELRCIRSLLTSLVKASDFDLKGSAAGTFSAAGKVICSEVIKDGSALNYDFPKSSTTGEAFGEVISKSELAVSSDDQDGLPTPAGEVIINYDPLGRCSEVIKVGEALTYYSSDAQNGMPTPAGEVIIKHDPLGPCCEVIKVGEALTYGPVPAAPAGFAVGITTSGKAISKYETLACFIEASAGAPTAGEVFIKGEPPDCYSEVIKVGKSSAYYGPPSVASAGFAAYISSTFGEDIRMSESLAPGIKVSFMDEFYMARKYMRGYGAVSANLPDVYSQEAPVPCGEAIQLDETIARPVLQTNATRRDSRVWADMFSDDDVPVALPALPAARASMTCAMKHLIDKQASITRAAHGASLGQDTGHQHMRVGSCSSPWPGWIDFSKDTWSEASKGHGKYINKGFNEGGDNSKGTGKNTKYGYELCGSPQGTYKGKRGKSSKAPARHIGRAPVLFDSTDSIW